jgi:hypothetical protein
MNIHIILPTFKHTDNENLFRERDFSESAFFQIFTYFVFYCFYTITSVILF